MYIKSSLCKIINTISSFLKIFSSMIVHTSAFFYKIIWRNSYICLFITYSYINKLDSAESLQIWPITHSPFVKKKTNVFSRKTPICLLWGRRPGQSGCDSTVGKQGGGGALQHLRQTDDGANSPRSQLYKKKWFFIFHENQKIDTSLLSRNSRARMYWYRFSLNFVICWVKGSVSRQVRPILLYIIRKLSL